MEEPKDEWRKTEAHQISRRLVVLSSSTETMKVSSVIW